MIPHWKSKDFLTSSGMKAMGTCHRKKVPTSFSCLLPTLEQPQMLLKRPDVGKQLQVSLKSRFVGDRSVPFNKSNAADWCALHFHLTPSATGFLMATCHRSRCSTARRGSPTNFVPGMLPPMERRTPWCPKSHSTNLSQWNADDSAEKSSQQIISKHVKPIVNASHTIG